MKVFILQFYDAHDTWTQGVYQTRELAEYCYDSNPEWSEGYAGHSIVEHVLITESCVERVE